MYVYILGRECLLMLDISIVILIVKDAYFSKRSSAVCVHNHMHCYPVFLFVSECLSP